MAYESAFRCDLCKRRGFGPYEGAIPDGWHALEIERGRSRMPERAHGHVCERHALTPLCALFDALLAANGHPA